MDKLDESQTKRLCSLLTQGIRQMGDAHVVAPTFEDFTNAVSPNADGVPVLAVDIDMGGFVLPIDAEAWEFRKDRRDHVESLAHLLLARIEEASAARVRHIRHIEKTRTLLERRIIRMDADIELLDVRPARWRLSESMVGNMFKMTATLRMLDDLLRPEIRHFAGATSQDLVSDVRYETSVQRRRRSNLKRLGTAGAILEIDELAERALAMADRSIADVMPLLDPERGHLGKLLESPSGSVSVFVRNGLITSSVHMLDVGLLSGSTLRIDSVIPQSAALALRGQPASKLVNHPILAGETKIRRVVPGEQNTDVDLQVRRRKVYPAELRLGALAQAA